MVSRVLDNTHAGRALTIGALVILFIVPGAWSCGGDKASPAARPERAAAAPQPKAEVKPERPRSEPRLDSFGNLRGSGRHVLGFELPVGATDRPPVAKMQVSYVAANEPRLLRFYRSRGHRVTETTGGWRLQHSERTLAAVEPGKREELGKAMVHVTQGPGPGHTLRFDDGAPIEVAQPALVQLVRAATPADELVAEPAGAEPAAPGTDPTAPGLFQDETTAGDRDAAAARRKMRRATARRLDPAEIARLRKAALGRKFDKSRARDVSERILDYVEANPGKGFRD